jgi:hypothetical protein
MARNLLNKEDTDGSQRTSEDISEMLIGRFFETAGSWTRRPRFNDLGRDSCVASSGQSHDRIDALFHSKVTELEAGRGIE